MSTFTDNLNRLLRERGVSKKALSQATNIPASTLSEWSNGREPTLSEPVVRLAQYLGVTLEYLVTGRDVEEHLLKDIVDNGDSFVQIHYGTYRITVEKKEK